MKKTVLTILGITIIALIIVGIIFINNKSDKIEIVSVKSEKQLEKIYNKTIDDSYSLLDEILTLPISFFTRDMYRRYNSYDYYYEDGIKTNGSLSRKGIEVAADVAVNESSSSSSSDYSKTNIQVENVDEADIIKTDGEYIYSISGTDVIITDAKNPEEIKIASKITTNAMPEDIILYKDRLVVIQEKDGYDSSWYYNSYRNNTVVAIYDIQNRENPKLVKSFELFEPYYTTRCIEGKLYVISAGSLRKDDNDEIITYYNEDRNQIDIGLKNIKYIKNKETDDQTLIAMLDLNDLNKNVNVSSYLMDVENAYISEKNIYLLDNTYEYSNSTKINWMAFLGFKGVFGFEDAIDYDYDDSGNKTKIYKFNILDDGTIKFAAKATTDGQTINQFSIDEYNGNLRIALYDWSDGSRIEVYDENMNKIGETAKLAKGEKMYSSRFMGNKAYLVTYKTIDPLFVIDLSDPTNPKVEGELKIPGYSTYLHPYDETHLIGIGMQTEETVNRDYYTGRITSTSARITGMKMALFDVSDVNNPKQISEAVIGDSRTTSAILTNHKALLFSKEKELLAIPVNNYTEDFEVETDSDEYEYIINTYTMSSTNYVSEGYLVYNINLTDGITEKGSVTHDYSQKKSEDDYYYYSYNTSKLLRGLYINDNLFTVSEEQIKVNKLSNMEQIGELAITERINKLTETEINKPIEIVEEISYPER